MKNEDDFQESDLTPRIAEQFENFALALGAIGAIVVLILYAESLYNQYAEFFYQYLKRF